MREIFRTENSKIFDLGGNKRLLRASVGPIHYKETYAKGEPWLDIDRTSRVDEGDTWYYNKLPVKIRIKKDATAYEIESRRTGQKISAELLSDKEGLTLEPIIGRTRLELWQESEDDRIVQWKIKEDGKGNLNFRDEPLAFVHNEAFPEGEEIFKEARLEKARDGEKIWEVQVKKGERIDPTVDYDVVASSDDGHSNVPDVNGIGFSSNQITISFFIKSKSNPSFNTGIFVRFPNVAIPQGSNILSAIWSATSTNSQSSTPVIYKVHLNDVDDAVAPTTRGEFNSLALTTESEDWTMGATSTGVRYDSPDLADAVQEVVDRGGWSSGNALMVIFMPDIANSSNDGIRVFASYDHTTLAEPSIEIEYEEGGGAEEADDERDIETHGQAVANAVRTIGATGSAQANDARDIEANASAEAAAERGIEAEGTIAPVLSAGQVDDKIRLTWTYAPE